MLPPNTELAEALGIPPEMFLLCAAITDLQRPLFPQEEQCIPNAVPKRRHEFTAGRTASRIALQHLGLSRVPILADTDRTPIWPDGIVGSITHTDQTCGVLLSRSNHFRSVGIDMEEIGRVTPDLWRLVFTQEEIQLLSSPEEATHLFSMKEAFFKLQYMHTRTVIDYRDLDIQWISDNCWTLQLPRTPSSCERLVAHGRTVQSGNEVIAACTLQ